MRILTCVAALLLSVAAHAAPAAPTGQDDVHSLLVQKGLIERLGEVRTALTQRTSALATDALNFLGVPYRLGGTSVETGFDCSGFVRAMYDQTVGLMLPRRAEEQAAATQPIDKSDMKPGDLVFFNTMRRTFSHVGIYLGDGKFIHAPRTGASVRIEDMSVGYWTKRFNGARRVDASRTEVKHSAE